MQTYTATRLTTAIHRLLFLPISPEGGGTSVHRLPFGCSFFDGGSTVNRLLFLFFNLIMAYIYAVNTEQL